MSHRIQPQNNTPNFQHVNFHPPSMTRPGIDHRFPLQAAEFSSQRGRSDEERDFDRKLPYPRPYPPLPWWSGNEYPGDFCFPPPWIWNQERKY